jgi:fucose permease
MRIGRGLDVLSLGSFVVLGLPDGMLGTAWPSMRQSFGAPIADLGLILLVITIGSVAVSVFVGALIRRFGVPVLLALSGACAAVGAAAFAVAPGIWLVFVVAALLGVAAGMMDGGLNTTIGLSGRPRLLNLLHAAYGVGTTIGPLVVTAAIVLSSWRPAYVALVVLDLMIAVLWLVQRRNEQRQYDRTRQPAAVPPGDVITARSTDSGEPDGGAVPPREAITARSADSGEPTPDSRTALTGHPSEAWSRRRSSFVVAAGMAIFFVYTGVEVAAGQWEASFCRGHLGLSASAAGIATFGFWGALTGARIVLALLPRPLRPSLVVWWGSGIALLATAVIWWQPGTPVTLAGFVVLGAALAGVFPAMIALTPDRIGRGRAQHVIAWQVGAAAAGGSGLSALIGLFIALAGLSVLGPSLTVMAVLLAVGIIVLERVAPMPAAVSGPDATSLRPQPGDPSGRPYCPSQETPSLVVRVDGR